MKWGCWCLLGIIFASACGSGPTSPSTSSGPRNLHGAVTDPAGDARRTSSNPPDLTAASIDVANGVVTITIDYVAGSVSQTDVYIVVVLDTDLNPATGYPGVTSGGTDASVIGGDYLVNIPLAVGGSVAAITRAATDRTEMRVGTANVAFGGSELQLNFPLGVLAGSDGHMAFKVVSAQYLSGTTTITTGVSDIMPDAGLAPGVVQ